MITEQTIEPSGDGTKQEMRQSALVRDDRSFGTNHPSNFLKFFAG